MRIVGVISDTKKTDVTEATRPEIYFCLAQMEPGTPLYGIAIAFMQVAIRGRIPADSLRAQFDKVLHQVAPDATTTEVKTIHEAVEDSFGSQKLIAHLLEGFAALALMIAIASATCSAYPGAFTSGTQIVTGFRPAAFILSRCFWTRFALSAMAHIPELKRYM